MRALLLLPLYTLFGLSVGVTPKVFEDQDSVSSLLLDPVLSRVGDWGTSTLGLDTLGGRPLQATPGTTVAPEEVVDGHVPLVAPEDHTRPCGPVGEGRGREESGTVTWRYSRSKESVRLPLSKGHTVLSHTSYILTPHSSCVGVRGGGHVVRLLRLYSGLHPGRESPHGTPSQWGCKIQGTKRRRKPQWVGTIGGRVYRTTPPGLSSAPRSTQSP